MRSKLLICSRHRLAVQYIERRHRGFVPVLSLPLTSVESGHEGVEVYYTFAVRDEPLGTPTGVWLINRKRTFAQH